MPPFQLALRVRACGSASSTAASDTKREATSDEVHALRAVAVEGQTTLPKPVRETLGVKAGDRLRYVVSDGEVRILPVRPISRLYGTPRHPGRAVTVEQMEQGVADRAAEE